MQGGYYRGAGLGLAAVDTVVLLPRLYGWTAQEVVAARTEANARRSAREKFLSRNLSPGGEALILSFISGVCHLESRTASPVRAPGYVELFLRKDWNRISAWLLEPGGSKRLVVDAYILKGGSIFADGVASDLLVTLKGWRIREVTPDGRLAVLEPKEVSGPDA